VGPSLPLAATLSLSLSLLASCSSASAPPAPSPPPEEPLSPAALALLRDLQPRPADAGAPPLSDRRAQALSADLGAREREARASSPPPARLVTTSPFVLVAGDPHVPLDASAALVERFTSALYGPGGPFEHRCDTATTAWLYSTAAGYQGGVQQHLPAIARGPAAASLALYDSPSATLVTRTDVPAWQGTTTLLDEISAPLVACDFPLRRRWLGAGLGGLFEELDLSHPGEIRPRAHFRLQTLRDVLAHPDAGPYVGLAGLVRLDALFAFDDKALTPATGDPNAYLYVAVASQALRWLDDQGHLWPFYEAWRDGVLEDRTGERAFAKVVGKTPAAATPEWLAWIDSAASETRP
jgi:hypothetical protein